MSRDGITAALRAEHVEHDDRVLAYYGREAASLPPEGPLAGLKLAGFQSARRRLIARGLLTRTPNARYIPANLLAVVA